MRRLDPTSLLVLAVGVAATLGLTAALGSLAQVDGIASIQHSLHEHLLSIQLGPLDRPVTIATQIGDLPTVFGVAIGGGLALGLIARSAWPVVLLLVSVVVERWLQLGLISLVGAEKHFVTLAF